MIEALSISVAHGSHLVLREVDFVARPGQLTAVIGPNGSGKTTLVKALSGELPYDGSVRLNGRDLGQLSAAGAAAIRAVLPQASTLPFPFTVREVITLGLSAAYPLPTGPARQRRPDAALARVGLAGFGGRFYGDLSGGEQQRVQLARVLCQVWDPVFEGTPRYLLLDEPVSSLDIKHQLQIMSVARQFAEAGGGVVAVLHDLNLTAMYADRVVALCDGQVAGAGTPAEVLTDRLLTQVFDCPLRAGTAPADTPFVLPQSVDRGVTSTPTLQVAS